ncbi:MAG: SpoIIE family protein phosphatase [Bacteroidota bacterium]|nr:SpoIIE family protein phosphatase [Bacteroidota bacterium]
MPHNHIKRSILFVLLIFGFIFSYAQQNKLKDYDLFLGDTIDRIDANDLKQGRWVYFGKDKNGLKNKVLKHNQITEEGVFLNDKKNGVWKTYHIKTNKLKSEVLYVGGVTSGKAKFYSEKGKLIKEGILRSGQWSGEYYLYDEKGNKIVKKAWENNDPKNTCLNFSGIVAKNGNSLEGVKIVIEKNEIETGQFYSAKNGSFDIKLELNNVYVLKFSKEGVNKESLIINTDVKDLSDTSVYELKDWKINMNADNIAAAATNDLFGFLLNKPSRKIYFNKKRKQFMADGSYEHLFKKQLNDISETTKILLTSAAEDNKKLEIEKLRVESENKLKEIELLRKNKELQDAELSAKEAELLTQKLEAEKKEQSLALFEKEKQIKELKFKEQEAILIKQQLEAEKKARDIERLSMAKKLQEIMLKENQQELTKTTSELTEKEKEAVIKEKEITVLSVEKEEQSKELKQKRTIIFVGMAGLLMIAGFSFVLWRNIRQKKKANLVLARQADEINRQKNEIEEKSRVIEEKSIETEQSIIYAQRIQHAILPPLKEIDEYLDHYFVLYKSKDIVSGDFYFFSDKYANKEENGKVIIAAADCTGHGVPGAFMSLVGCEKLKDAVDISSEPGEILKELNIGLKAALRQTGDNATSTRDGMDIALCAIPLGINKKEEVTIKFAGANRPIWIIKHNSRDLIEIKATKHAIGGLTKDEQAFEQHEVTLNKGDVFYLFSDGFADQFGGVSRKKLMTKKFKEILIEISTKEMKDQRNYLHDFMEEWKGDVEQIDDILVIGVKV